MNSRIEKFCTCVQSTENIHTSTWLCTCRQLQSATWTCITDCHIPFWRFQRPWISNCKARAAEAERRGVTGILWRIYFSDKDGFTEMFEVKQEKKCQTWHTCSFSFPELCCIKVHSFRHHGYMQWRHSYTLYPVSGCSKVIHVSSLNCTCVDIKTYIV